MLAINTPEGIERYRKISVAKACKLYANTGIVPTRAVTATILLKQAQTITGKVYKRGQHMMAHDDIMGTFAE